MATTKDFYEILGVSKDATTDDIKKAFRKKAATMHPDVNKAPDAEERFKEVSEAYETLSDPDKRARYDAVRSGGFTTDSPFRGAGSTGSPYGNPSDPFGWASWGWGGPFGGGYASSSGSSSRAGAAYVVEPGATRRISMSLTAEEAKKGCTKTVSFERLEACPSCSGRGCAEGSSPSACPTCHGSGQAEVNVGGLFATAMRCPTCQGSGKVVRDACPSCSGSGTRRVRATARVEVPAATHDGQSMRIAGQGDAGRCGGASGDLQVDFEVPSEHLTHEQELGFTAAGVLAAVLVGVFLYDTVMRVFTFLALPLFFVFFFVSPSIFRAKGGSFWQRAGRRFGYGFLMGLFVFIVFSPLVSCARWL